MAVYIPVSVTLKHINIDEFFDSFVESLSIHIDQNLNENTISPKANTHSTSKKNSHIVFCRCEMKQNTTSFLCFNSFFHFNESDGSNIWVRDHIKLYVKINLSSNQMKLMCNKMCMNDLAKIASHTSSMRVKKEFH